MIDTHVIKTDVDFFGDVGHALFFYDATEYKAEVEIRHNGDEIVSILIGGCEVDSEWDCFDDLAERCMEIWTEQAAEELNDLVVARAELDSVFGMEKYL